MVELTEEEIINNWRVSDTPLVSIECWTYNHENYISQTLDGFLMQKTDFPFEVIVHDDASTDNTANIIRQYEHKYPSIIRPIYETENQYSKRDGSIDRIVFSKMRGKYIACCEGDDYWIDNNKLQLQVNFLEKNQSYGLCYTYARKFFQKENRFSDELFGKWYKNTKNLIQNGDCIPTLTLVYKKDLYSKYLEEVKPHEKRWRMGDYPLVIWFSINSKIHMIKKETAIYRILEKSACHFEKFEDLLKFYESTDQMLDFFKDKYNLLYKMPNNAVHRKFSYYLSEHNREKVLENLDFCKSFKEKIYICIYKNKILYKMYMKYLDYRSR